MHKIIVAALKELLLALVVRVTWKAVAERFLTRLVIYGLEKLRDMSTNKVVDDTVTDIILSLQGKGLVVADQRELPNRKV